MNSKLYHPERDSKKIVPAPPPTLVPHNTQDNTRPAVINFRADFLDIKGGVRGGDITQMATLERYLEDFSTDASLCACLRSLSSLSRKSARPGIL